MRGGTVILQPLFSFFKNENQGLYIVQQVKREEINCPYPQGSGA